MREAIYSGDIRAVVFDADDTLWDCQSHFESVQDRYGRLLSSYGLAPECVGESLFSTECRNMPLLGYGVKAFTISLIENACAMTHGTISGSDIKEIIEMGRSLLTFEVRPFAGICDTLSWLSRIDGVRVALFTKGELLDQQSKLARSGLSGYFDVVDIVSDKTPQAVLSLCQRMNVEPCRTLVVGNSFKSDVLPAIEAGAKAAYVPSQYLWLYESAEEFEHPEVRTYRSVAEIFEVTY